MSRRERGMANIKVRFLTKRPGKDGMPRYFWQPSSTMQKTGLAQFRRVPLDWQKFSDHAALEAAAIVCAQQLNQELDERIEQQRPTLPAASRQGLSQPALWPRLTRTGGELIALYKRSDKYQRLKKSTKRSYDQCLERIETWCGPIPVPAIDRKRVQNFKASMKAT